MEQGFSARIAHSKFARGDNKSTIFSYFSAMKRNAPSADLQQLATKVWEGDPKAPIQLRNELSRIGMPYLRDLKVPKEDVQDILQQKISTLISRLYRQEDAVYANVKAYFITSIKNEGVRVAQRLARFDSIDTGEEKNLSFHSPNLEDDLANKDELDKKIIKLRGCLRKLGSGCQDLLHHCYHKDLTHSQVAELLGMSGADSVKARKSQCINRLREIYSQSIPA